MEREKDYLEFKNIYDLLITIDDWVDMDEIIEALDMLSDLDSEKALERGIGFLWNNVGDEYFQAMIIDIIDYISFISVLDCLINRKDDIQPYLLGEVMQEMRRHSIGEEVIEYIKIVNQKYIMLEIDEQKKINEQYNSFVDTFKVFINEV